MMETDDDADGDGGHSKCLNCSNAVRDWNFEAQHMCHCFACGKCQLDEYETGSLDKSSFVLEEIEVANLALHNANVGDPKGTFTWLCMQCSVDIKCKNNCLKESSSEAAEQSPPSWFSKYCS